MHVLGTETKQYLIGEIPDLSDVEKGILKDNGYFFCFFSTHALAERIKKLPEINDDVKEYLMFKRHCFLQMMTSFVPSPASPGQADPVVKYGWDRTENAVDLEKLQRQDLDITMRCYETGYIAKVPLWQEFLTQPSY